MARATTRIDRHEVVRAALDILEQHGSEGLTMRRLGEQMGVAGGAFYHHFQDKSDILRAAARFAVAEIDVPPVEDFGSWRDWVVQVACNYRAMLVTRPYIAPLLLGGYVARSGLPVYAIERSHLSAEGITEDRHETVFDTLEAFVLGSAMVASTRERASRSAEQQAVQDFQDGLRILLDGLVARARAPRTVHVVT